MNYLNPFEEETADEEYPMSFGKFKVSRLRLKEISVQALGIYQCYDANDLDIPAKNISVSISRKPKSNSVAKPLVHGVIAIIVVAIVIIVTVIIITIRWMFIKSIRKQKVLCSVCSIYIHYIDEHKLVYNIYNKFYYYH